MQIEEIRGEESIVPEIRLEVATPIVNTNMTRNHPIDQIIGSKDKGVMIRSKVNEEICDIPSRNKEHR